MYADEETLYRTTIDRNPDCWLAQNNLGTLLAKRGQFEEAIGQFDKALEVNPDSVESHMDLGAVLATRGKFPEAVAQYEKALKIMPDCVKAHINLGSILAGRARLAEAIAQYQKALEIKPDCAEAYADLGLIQTALGQHAEAITDYEKALASKPNYVLALKKLAWLRATNPEARFRDGGLAVTLAEHAAELTRDDPETLDILAVAYAEAGRFEEAVQIARSAVDLALRQKKSALADTIQTRISLYEARIPFRELPPAR
jgi:Flp pilus assembly protein TadD